jgi:benzylsuccinate CoA-transferase BbsE subunit
MLSPYRVLDLTDGRAELATFVLAGFGADVVKVEPPGGSPSRQEDPTAPDEPSSLASLRFHAYNRGKRSVVLDLDRPDDRRRFLSLVATADFVVENAGPGVMTGRGLGYDVLRDARPDLRLRGHLHLRPGRPLRPPPRHRSDAGRHGRGHALNGDPDRPPCASPSPRRGTTLPSRAPSAPWWPPPPARHRQSRSSSRLGAGGRLLDRLNAMIAHAIQGRNIERFGTVLQLSTLTTPLVYPCADGEVCSIATSNTLEGLVPWMVETGTVTPEWAAAEDGPPTRPACSPPNSSPTRCPRCEAITEFTMQVPKVELFEGGIARGITLAPVNTVADVLTVAQLVARLLGRCVAAERRPCAARGRSWRLWPVGWDRPAPDVGQHTAEASTGWTRQGG